MEGRSTSSDETNLLSSFSLFSVHCISRVKWVSSSDYFRVIPQVLPAQFVFNYTSSVAFVSL